jgi:hypothetical protein
MKMKKIKGTSVILIMTTAFVMTMEACATAKQTNKATVTASQISQEPEGDEKETYFITITGITIPGTAGAYVGGCLLETENSPVVVNCFSDYISRDGSLTMPLFNVYLDEDEDDVGDPRWNGTGDYFVYFGDESGGYITKNKVSFTQAETTVGFSEFVGGAGWQPPVFR